MLGENEILKSKWYLLKKYLEGSITGSTEYEAFELKGDSPGFKC